MKHFQTIKGAGYMNLKEVFDLAIQAEQNISVCYDEMNLAFQNESFSDEFTTLSKEEIDHRNLLMTGKNYLEEASDILSGKPKEIAKLRSGLTTVSKLIDRLRNRDIGLKEALNNLIELEKVFEKFHLIATVEVKDPSLKKLFEALSLGDKLHKARLVKIRSKYFI